MRTVLTNGGSLLDLMAKRMKNFSKLDFARVDFCQNELVCDPQLPLSHILFPTSATLSLLVESGPGEWVEVGSVGNDGFVGLSLVLGSDRTQAKVICQLSGSALKMNSRDFLFHLKEDEEFRTVINLNALQAVHHIAQLSACNAHHNGESRCARWLLMAAIRTGRPLDITQAQLAKWLGVRRSLVNKTLREFQSSFLIKQGREKITILDFEGLEARACDCLVLLKGG